MKCCPSSTAHIENWIIITFKLIIFYCLTTFYNIKFFNIFLFGSLLITFQNLSFKNNYFVCWRNEVLSFSPGYLIIKKNRLMYYIKGVYTEESYYTSIIILHILKENFQKLTRWFLRFFSYSCRSGLIQICLLHFK